MIRIKVDNDKIIIRMSYEEYQKYKKPYGFVWDPYRKEFYKNVVDIYDYSEISAWIEKNKSFINPADYKDISDFIDSKSSKKEVDVSNGNIYVPFSHNVIDKLGKKKGNGVVIKDCYAARYIIDKFLGTKLIEEIEIDDRSINEVVNELPDFLYEHQIEGVAWILSKYVSNKSGCLLADDMGLGKTVQSIASYIAIKKYSNNPNMKLFVVAPKSTLKNAWYKDAKKFFDIELNVLDASDFKSGNYNYDCIVTNYESIVAAENELKDFALTEDYFLVLDEVTKVKNYESTVHKIIKKIRGKAFVLALSGTPVENNIKEFYSIMQIVDPNFMTFKIFKDMFAVFEDKYFGRKKVHMIVGHRNTDLFYELVKDYMLRRTKDRVVILPKKNIYKIEVPLLEEQKKAVEKIKHYAAAMYKNEDIAKLSTITLIKRAEDDIRLIKLTDSKMLPQSFIDSLPDLKSPKLSVLLDIVKKGGKTVVFTEYSDMADLIQQELEENGISCVSVTGADTIKTRNKKIERFKNEVDVLIATDALTYGVNLHFADQLVNFDIPWNPGKRAQRMDRIYRLGIKKEKTIYDLVTDGIEEIVYEIIQHKLFLFAKLVEGKENVSSSSIINQIAKKVFSAKK